MAVTGLQSEYYNLVYQARYMLLVSDFEYGGSSAQNAANVDIKS